MPAIIEIPQAKILTQALTLAAATALKKSARPILTCALLHANGKALVVSATDETHFAKEVVQPTDQVGKIAVKAKDLLEVVKALKQDAALTLEIEEEGSLCRVRQFNGRISFDLLGLNGEDFPLAIEPDPQNFFSFPLPELVQALENTVFACSTDEARYYLGGVHFRYEALAKTLRFEATDGHRLTIYKLGFEKDEDAPVRDALESYFGGGRVVSRTLIENVLKAAKKTKEGDAFALGVWESRIFFNFGDREVSGVFIEGSFPDVRQVIPTKHQIRFVVGVGDAMDALKRVSLVNDQKMLRLSYAPRQNALTISAQVGGKAAKESLGVQGNEAQKDIEIGFNAILLFEALAKLADQGYAHASFNFTNYLAPLAISPAVKGIDDTWQDDTKVLSVVMPARL